MNEAIATEAFNALANPTRLRIIRALVNAGKEGLSAGSIAELIDASPSRATFHHRQLAETHLICATKKSRQVIYTINFESIGSLVQFLIADCCNNNATVRACCGLQKC